MNVSTVQNAKVAIVLGYYHGHPYIVEQLKSIQWQSITDVHVYLFNDDPGDNQLLPLLKDSGLNLTNISIVERSHNFGYCRNFLMGLEHVGPGYDYYAYSDQDDIWLPGKLENALNRLTELKVGHPTLYCSRTDLVDQTGQQQIGQSPKFKKTPSFQNALVQNIGGGIPWSSTVPPAV